MNWETLGRKGRYVNITFTIFMKTCGVLLIVLGSIMISKMGNFSSLQKTFNMNRMAIIILVMGCLIILSSVTGCWSCICENYECFFIIYPAIMMVVFICNIAFITYIWRQHTEILKSLEMVVLKIWEQRMDPTNRMDRLEISFECCGYNSYMDYNGDDMPASCCNSSVQMCSVQYAEYRIGCKISFITFWENILEFIMFAGLGVAAVELTAFITACFFIVPWIYNIIISE